MSANKHTFRPHRYLHSLPQLLLACTLNITCAHAETATDLRYEPIFPIPQTIEFDASKAEIGKRLFFDTRLSKDNSIACATCHQLEAGGDDNVATGISSDENNVFNTPSIFNTLYNFRQNWDGSI